MIRFVKKLDSKNNEIGVSLEIEFGGKQAYLPSISFDQSNDSMIALKNQIEDCLNISEIKDKFECSTEVAYEIIDFHLHNKKCTNCSLKFKNCYNCIYKYTDDIQNYLYRKYLTLGWNETKISKEISENSRKIKKEHETYSECKYNYKYNKIYPCHGKNKYCYECVFVCQSPLERKLFMGLAPKFPNVELQKRINKDGTSYNYPDKVIRANILTFPDFYISENNKKICIYADGFTYHNKEEKQVIHDNNIDRKLQKLGYTVLRFSTKEITNGLAEVIDTISDTVDD